MRAAIYFTPPAGAHAGPPAREAAELDVPTLREFGELVHGMLFPLVMQRADGHARRPRDGGSSGARQFW